MPFDNAICQKESAKLHCEISQGTNNAQVLPMSLAGIKNTKKNTKLQNYLHKHRRNVKDTRKVNLVILIMLL